MATAQEWVEALQLRSHPEGGFFRETYRAAGKIARDHLPAGYGGDRNFVTSIYFLLRSGDFSALHRLRQDEIWHFYDGGTLTISVIDPQGERSAIRLGRDVRAGETLQAVVPGGCLFGARVETPETFALVGCDVAPGFDFADFEMPARAELLKVYPRHRELIEQLTR
ncbi:MAG: cupin domain-containing protein [Planctomycetia bacterium]|nr:cupin domain-containing protein [Planctomycetia bacterium]